MMASFKLWRGSMELPLVFKFETCSSILETMQMILLSPWAHFFDNLLKAQLDQGRTRTLASPSRNLFTITKKTDLAVFLSPALVLP
jgi:hypothetical protein